MKKINYIRSHTSILIVTILSSIMCFPCTELRKSQGISIVTHTKGITTPGPQLFVVEKEREYQAKSGFVIHTIFSLTRLYMPDASQTDFRAQKRSGHVTSSFASLISGARHCLVGLEILV